MSSSYKPQVGDIVIPSCGKFEGLRCRIACIATHVGVECLQKEEEGHYLEGRLSKPNGWWYRSSDLKHQAENNSSFKAGDRVSSPDYPERGPGTVKESNVEHLILVEHDDIFEDGHDGDGICIEGKGWYYSPNQLQIVHEVKPDNAEEVTSLHGYSLGDRVKGYNGTGTVVHFSETDSIGVEHDEYIGYHDCRGHGRDGYCYYYNYKGLEKLEPTSLNTVGIGSIGMTGTIVGSSGSTALVFNPYTSTNVKYHGGSGIWAAVESFTESKKPKNSVDKYIQDPIIPKKTRKKKSLVIV